MFLRQLKLTNVRSIKELEIDFSSIENVTSIRKWTLLLAENGTGKTCVLRSIGLLLAGGDSLFKLVTDIDGWIRNGAKAARMEAIIETEKGEQRPLWLEFVRGMTALQFSRHNESGIKLLESALAHAQRNYFIVGYGASRRLPGATLSMTRPRHGSENYLPQRGQSMASIFSADAELNSLQSWAMDLDYEHGASGLAIIESAINFLLPGVTFHKIDKKRKELLFETTDGIVPLGRLSDGYQSMAGWIGDLLFQITQTFADLKSPLTARGLLLLDEMDLHLHPIWQRQLMAFLSQRLPNFQIIATTHSPLTAQQAGPGELHLLERTTAKSGPTIRRFDGSPRLMRLEDLAVSPWFGLTTAYSLEVEALRKKYEAEQAVRSKGRKRAPTRGSFSVLKPGSGIQNSGTHTVMGSMETQGRADAGGTTTAKAALDALGVVNPRTALEQENFELLKRLEAVVTGGTMQAKRPTSRAKVTSRSQATKTKPARKFTYTKVITTKRKAARKSSVSKPTLRKSSARKGR